MLTALGNFLRRLRSQHDEVLKDMANKLGVSSAFLSAVENGTKRMPERLLGQIIVLYHLDDQQTQQLRNVDEESRRRIELNIENVDPANRKLAVVFARSFERLDTDTAAKILDLLGGNDHMGGVDD